MKLNGFLKDETQMVSFLMFNISSHHGNVNLKTTWKFHLAPVRMAEMTTKKQNKANKQKQPTHDDKCFHG